LGDEWIDHSQAGNGNQPNQKHDNNELHPNAKKKIQFTSNFRYIGRLGQVKLLNYSSEE
jgi:hypothetical protein